jgi:hypothetical protein
LPQGHRTQPAKAVNPIYLRGRTAATVRYAPIGTEFCSAAKWRKWPVLDIQDIAAPGEAVIVERSCVQG